MSSDEIRLTDEEQRVFDEVEQRPRVSGLTLRRMSSDSIRCRIFNLSGKQDPYRNVYGDTVMASLIAARDATEFE